MTPARRGYIARIDVRAVGLAVLALGGGRRRVEDRIDYGVGLTDMRGHRREVGRPAARHRPCASDGDAATGSGGDPAGRRDRRRRRCRPAR